MNNIFMALQLIITIVLIISVITQDTKGSAGSAIMGGSSQTTHFKPKGKDALFSKITKISAILYFINAIVLVAFQ